MQKNTWKSIKLTSRYTGCWRSPHRLSRRLYLSFRLMCYGTSDSQLILNGPIAELSAKPCLQWIVLAAIIISIEEFFKPLQKFEIILESTFDQFIHGNYLNGWFSWLFPFSGIMEQARFLLTSIWLFSRYYRSSSYYISIFKAIFIKYVFSYL